MSLLYNNMPVEKKAIIAALNNSIKVLQQDIDAHGCLVASLLDKPADERNLKAFIELYPGRARELRLEKAIREAIDVIEASRKSFKSKRLEALRKKLTNVLMDRDVRA